TGSEGPLSPPSPRPVELVHWADTPIVAPSGKRSLTLWELRCVYRWTRTRALASGLQLPECRCGGVSLSGVPGHALPLVRGRSAGFSGPGSYALPPAPQSRGEVTRAARLGSVVWGRPGRSVRSRKPVGAGGSGWGCRWRLEDLGVGRGDGRGAPGRPPSGPWNLKPDTVALLELGIEQCMMDRGLSQDSRLERKKRPKSQELSPTEAFARKELPSSMNLMRPTVDGCWRSTTADGWELGDELEKQKIRSAISGLTGHKQGEQLIQTSKKKTTWEKNA
uniref:Uncharacterized protein n=1 Tax=Mustela putorius furo TaxID=9669 RepID=M3YAJ8_MUSPF